jgi:hypothetical protein
MNHFCSRMKIVVSIVEFLHNVKSNLINFKHLCLQNGTLQIYMQILSCHTPSTHLPRGGVYSNILNSYSPRELQNSRNCRYLSLETINITKYKALPWHPNLNPAITHFNFCVFYGIHFQGLSFSCQQCQPYCDSNNPLPSNSKNILLLKQTN